MLPTTLEHNFSPMLGQHSTAGACLCQKARNRVFNFVCVCTHTHIYIYLKLKDLNVIGPFWFWKEPWVGQWPFRGSGKSKISKYFNARTVCRFTLLLSSSDSRRFPTSTYGIQNDIVEPNHSVDVAVLACFFIFLLPSDFLLIGAYTPQNIGKRSAVSALLRPLSLTKLF